ncbi:uncharacterized protein CIMG_13756 [Coccidioides immitis RS]|uniref:Uncharacterized protein n=1 Tax=Coccidioides immitis (strain RS) TaxID=246410 RepID=A0A0D8JW91_COCIM|nr:uncharacterized protein CIMG_13756 [Coccidioides immitis RS]KJF61587.1 hypothetical protein CIMG_13756 [Coccidioides immitis RS]
MSAFMAQRIDVVAPCYYPPMPQRLLLTMVFLSITVLECYSIATASSKTVREVLPGTGDLVKSSDRCMLRGDDAKRFSIPSHPALGQTGVAGMRLSTYALGDRIRR